ncbi:MAG: ATP-binding protein [Candidatus Micrarchaeota archaeon]
MRETEIMAILLDWNFWGNFKERLHARLSYLSIIEKISSKKTATVLSGVRRAGKSSLAYLFLQRLIGQKKKNTKDLLIVNFEDLRFPPVLTSKDLLDIYEAYVKNICPTKPFIVLDEVQVAKGWEKFVRYLLEVKKANVIVTGSSSKLLSREISTVITGRYVNVEVFPLSFKEFLDFKNLKLTNDLDVIKNKLSIIKFFEEYVRWGGFPEVVLSHSIQRKQELLRRYFDDILMKDTVKRFGITEIEKLENLASVYISNISTLQSFNKLKEKIGVSLDTVERFSKCLELSKLFFFLKKFDYSTGKQIRSVQKVYTIDPGFYSIKGFRFSENFGRIAENMVAIELFRRSALNQKLELYYWRDYQEREVDFVIKNRRKIKQLVQVTTISEFEDIDKKTLDSLVKASSETKCNNLVVITKDYENEQKIKGKTISFIPIWKYLIRYNR